MASVHRSREEGGKKSAAIYDEPDTTDVNNGVAVDPLNISGDSDVIMCDSNSEKTFANPEAKEKSLGPMLMSPISVSDSSISNPSPLFTEVIEIQDTDASADEEASKRKKRKESKPKEKEALKKPNAKNRSVRPSIPGSKSPNPAVKLDSATKTGDTSTSVKAQSRSGSGKTDKSSGITSRRSSALSGPNPTGKYSNPGSAGSSTSAESKSASPSPKPSYKQTEEEERTVENTGPKVPPLKIVIPGGIGAANSGSNQSEGDGTGNRKGKSGRSSLPHKKCSVSIPLEATLNISDSVLDKDKRLSVSEDSGGAGSAVGAGGLRVLRSHRSTDSTDKDKDKHKERTSPNCAVSVSPSPQIIAIPLQPAKTPPPPALNQQQECEPTSSSQANDRDITNDRQTSGGSASVAPVLAQPEKQNVAVSSATTCTQSTSSNATVSTSSAPVKLPPRKRKVKTTKEHHQEATKSAAAAAADSAATHQHTNSFQMYFNIRKQVERRQKGVFPVQPKPPKGFKDYLMNRCSYVLQKNAKAEPVQELPATLPPLMRDQFIQQEKDRHNLRLQHQVEKEKLVLAVEQEILRVHGRAARALANQALPFSACTFLRGREVYNMLTPEQEEKERNAQRPRYNGRLFLSWLQEVDDKWEKIKEGMVRRHHNEAESLHAVQTMDWEWKLKELDLCDSKATPSIDNNHVPMVLVSEDFDLLPD